MLNISEGGISIQAAAVLEAGETVPMWLEIPKVRNRVEVTSGNRLAQRIEERGGAAIRRFSRKARSEKLGSGWSGKRRRSNSKTRPDVVEEEESVPALEAVTGDNGSAPAVALAAEDDGGARADGSGHHERGRN